MKDIRIKVWKGGGRRGLKAGRGEKNKVMRDLKLKYHIVHNMKWEWGGSSLKAGSGPVRGGDIGLQKA